MRSTFGFGFLRNDDVLVPGFLALALLLWCLAFQFPFVLHLAIGGDPRTQRREDDAPFLQRANRSEPVDPLRADWWNLAPHYPYRWTTNATTLRVPGIGGDGWLVMIAALSGRPAIQTPTTWSLGRATLQLILAERRRYYLLVPPTASGDLVVGMQTTPFSLPDDPRKLGFVLRSVRVSSLTTGLARPATGQLAWLTLALALVYGLARWLQGRWVALGAAAIFMITTALTLARARTSLTLFAPQLVWLSLSCWAIALLVRFVWRHWLPNDAPALRNALIGLLVVGFAIRMGGMLHPTAIFSDAGLHANNILSLALGEVYFTEGLPSEAGGGESPYPPGNYLAYLPLALIAPEGVHRVLLVQLAMAFADSLVILFIGRMLVQAGVGMGGAWCGAACYLAPVPQLASFSIGEYANLGGQVLAMPLLLLLALPNQAQRPRPLLVAILLAGGLLSHASVTISVSLLLVGWTIMSSWQWLRGQREIGSQLSVVLGGSLVAGLFALLCYYSAPIFIELATARLTGAAPSGGNALGVVLLGFMQALFLPGSRLNPVLVIAGLGGLVLLLQRKGGQPLATVLASWWIGTILAQGLLLVANQGVRWQHFLVPALCIGAGALGDAVWRRGRVGRSAVILFVVALLGSGLFFWVVQIGDYLHG